MLKSFDTLPAEFQNEEVKKYYDILSRKKRSILLKRITDVILALILIILLCIPMLVIALIIKIRATKGPVFYKQERVTRYGKRFRILKFRTMVENADKIGSLVTTDSDSRVTKVGRFLRKYRLDELPQIFNILSGSMSIVGPRPERPEIAAEYEAHMPEFALRLQVKAGLTGYAQVYGKYNTPPYDKLQMDLMYIANQSLLEYLRLILMTLKIMFIPSSTEGISGDSRTAERERKNDN